MGAVTLVDTNVLLRLLQTQHPQHSVVEAALAELLRQDADLCIAPQNLVEAWVVATRPVAENGIGMTPLTIAAQWRRLTGAFRLLEGAPGVASAWEDLVVRHSVSGKKAHDAHLVAVMQVYGVTDVLTFNIADFQRYPGIHVLDPMQL